MATPSTGLTLNSDTIPVYFARQLGLRLMGDAELYLLGGMPLRAGDVVSVAALTTALAATTATGAAVATVGDAAIVQAEMTKRKASK